MLAELCCRLVEPAAYPSGGGAVPVLQNTCDLTCTDSAMRRNQDHENEDIGTGVAVLFLICRNLVDHIYLSGE